MKTEGIELRVEGPTPERTQPQAGLEVLCPVPSGRGQSPVPRRRTPPPEATQQLQALDVVELVRTSGAPSLRKSVPSSSSIAPVGLDLKPKRAVQVDEERNPTVQIRLPSPRRRLGLVVVGTLSACLLILVVAGAVRFVRGRSPSSEARSERPPTATAPTIARSAHPGGGPGMDLDPLQETRASSPATSGPLSAANVSGGGATTGTVRLIQPAHAGRVWLDGQKVSSSTALVSCGTHQVKVGLRRTHSIDVPCGGEIVVTK